MEKLVHAKHIIGEIDGVRCTIIESGISMERASFLSGLLKYNGLEVKMQKDAPAEGSTQELYTLGVTDLVFNPVYAIYELSLKRPDGVVVTPAYWRQAGGRTDGWYWTYGKEGVADYYE